MPMQTVIAAWCMTQPHHHSIVIARPAEGKTFAMLQFSRHLIKQDETGGTEVVIFCPVPQVAAQIREKLALFDVATQVLVTHNWQPNQWRQNEKN